MTDNQGPSKARDEESARAMIAEMFRKRNSRTKRSLSSIIQVWVVVGTPTSDTIQVSSGNPDDQDVWTFPRYPSVTASIGDVVLAASVRGKTRVVMNLSTASSTVVSEGGSPGTTIELVADSTESVDTVSVSESLNFILSDPADGFTVKKASWGFVEGLMLSVANLGAAISGATNSGIDIDDSFAVADSVTGDMIRVTWASILLELAGDFAALTHQHPGAGANSVALGPSAGAAGASGTALGQSASAGGTNGVALGKFASAGTTGALAIGDNSTVLSSYGIAIGSSNYISAGSVNALAIGLAAFIDETSPRSMALGQSAYVPASTPDTGILNFNIVRITRSNGTGATVLQLASADGTFGEIAVTDTDGLTVNGTPIGGGISDLGAAIAAATNVTPAIGDSFAISDDSASDALARVTWASILSALATDFQGKDTLLDSISLLSDPGADRVMFWDDSAGTITWLTLGTNLSITGTTLDAATGGAGSTNLSATLSASNTIVASDTGTDATIPAVDGTNAGVMTPTQKTKLDGIATGATANDTDANLKARANHTGTQLASTISDFSTAVEALPRTPPYKDLLQTSGTRDWGPGTHGLGVAYSSAIAATANTIYFHPIYFEAAETISRVTVNVQTAGAAGSVMRAGLFTGSAPNSSGPAGETQTLVVDWGTQVTDTTGTKNWTVSQAVSRGWYWFGFVFSATPTIHHYRAVHGLSAPSVQAIPNGFRTKIFHTAGAAAFASSESATLLSTEGASFSFRVS